MSEFDSAYAGGEDPMNDLPTHPPARNRPSGAPLSVETQGGFMTRLLICLALVAGIAACSVESRTVQAPVPATATKSTTYTSPSGSTTTVTTPATVYPAPAQASTTTVTVR